MILAHLYATKHAQNQHLQAFYSLTSKPLRYKKMQTYDTQSANHAQNTQPKSSGLFFLSLFSLALWLAYAVNQGLIIEGVIYAISYFYDDLHVKIHVSNIYPDLFLLSVILLALYGLHTLIRNYFAVTVAAVIIAIIAGVFLTPDTGKRHAVKDGESAARNYSQFGG